MIDKKLKEEIEKFTYQYHLPYNVTEMSYTQQLMLDYIDYAMEQTVTVQTSKVKDDNSIIFYFKPNAESIADFFENPSEIEANDVPILIDDIFTLTINIIKEYWQEFPIQLLNGQSDANTIGYTIMGYMMYVSDRITEGQPVSTEGFMEAYIK